MVLCLLTALCLAAKGQVKADDLLPVPWNGIDIGALNPAGAARADNGVFTLAGGSGALAGASDRFHFVYQSVTGDCILSARISAGAGPNGAAGGGLIARQALESGSDFVAVTLTPGGGIASDYRTLYAPETAASAEAVRPSSPIWVKLVKRGLSVQCFMAADRSGAPGGWKRIGGRQPIPSGMIYVGLCGACDAAGGAATFDHVSLVTGPQNLLDNGVYTISPADAPGMALVSSGAAVKLAASDGSAGQRWRLAGKGGIYSFQPLSDPSRVLSVPGAKTDNGSPVAAAADQGQSTQRWSIAANRNGTYSLLPQFNAGVCLDDFGGVGTPDATIDLWGFNSADPHLQWNINSAE